MISLRTIPKKDYHRATWKNGVGHTDEISIHPPGSDLRKGDFLWRVSSAQINQASDFSIFPNHDRLLVILNGPGIRLFHPLDDAEPVELPCFQPYEFPGDIQSRCELIERPVQDLSVFIRKGEAEATLSTIELDAGEPYSWIPTGRWNFILAPESDIYVQGPSGEGDQRLASGDALSVELDEPGEIPVLLRATRGSTRVIVVAIQA